jgi:hypothetical protein
MIFESFYGGTDGEKAKKYHSQLSDAKEPENAPTQLLHTQVMSSGPGDLNSLTECETNTIIKMRYIAVLFYDNNHTNVRHVCNNNNNNNKHQSEAGRCVLMNVVTVPQYGTFHVHYLTLYANGTEHTSEVQWELHLPHALKTSKSVLYLWVLYDSRSKKQLFP